MSKHRAADTSLTLTPLAARLAELAEHSARESANDPRFAAVHDHIAEVADVVREALHAAGAQQDRADALHDELVEQVQKQVDRMAEVLESGVRRLDGTGDALAAYLDVRDTRIEAERDRILREVLEDFATSLHARERRTVARRLVDAVDRRRDARDAAKWRREHGAELTSAHPRFAPATAESSGPRVIDLDAASKSRRATQRR